MFVEWMKSTCLALELMFKRPTTLCSGIPFCHMPGGGGMWERWDSLFRTPSYLGGHHEDCPDPKGMLAKASPFSQLKGRSSQLAPTTVLLEAGHPDRFPSLCCPPWSGLLPTSALWRTHQITDCSSRSGQRSSFELEVSSSADLRARSSGDSGNISGSWIQAFAKPCLFPLTLLAVSTVGMASWQVRVEVDCEFLEGRVCHLYAWHLLSTLPGAQGMLSEC